MKGRTRSLRIGDHWNAITIIALSQNNPLKAIAEFVENSIDAKARNIYIFRGKQQGEQYLKIVDDGEGITDFDYVATHIGDSIKRKLKSGGEGGIQGEFGIGLLSFWTVGEKLTLTSLGSDRQSRRMTLVKNNPSYAVKELTSLIEKPGTELHIQPLLPGIRMLNGEKIQAYLASELRDRIGKSGARVRIVDRTSRKEIEVEPRKFGGRLLHDLPSVYNPLGDVYVELYLSEESARNEIGLYKIGTRVLSDIKKLDAFQHEPWTSSFLEGIVDASFLQLTPGTRDGVILDAGFESLVASLAGTEEALLQVVADQKKAEEEHASRSILRRVTKALREAFLMLPREDYGWLNARSPAAKASSTHGPNGAGGTEAGGADAGGADAGIGVNESTEIGTAIRGEAGEAAEQKNFFEFPGPLYRLTISPTSSRVGVGERRNLHAVARDRERRPIDTGLDFTWSVVEGGGRVEGTTGEFADYAAPHEPETAVVRCTVRQGSLELTADATVTVVAELVSDSRNSEAALKNGLPGYTYRRHPGELWRSRYEVEASLIVVNNAHADFIFASKHEARKLRYIARLFAKEIVAANFPGSPKDELLERMVELTLYMEENLK